MNLSNHIKDHLGISQVAQEFNIGDLPSNGRANCPFCHGTKSLKVTRDQYFKCFKCNASGSVFDLLIQGKIASDFSESLKLLRPLVSNVYQRQEVTLSILDKLWKTLESHQSPEVITWLHSRGIVEQEAQISLLDNFGYWSPAVTKTIKDTFNAKEVALLEEYGLYPYERFEGRILTPIRNLSGRIVHYTGRAIDKSVEMRWLHTKGQPPINNYLYELHTVANQPQDYVILCEGVTDCMSLRSLKEPALACFGVNLPLTQHAWALKDKVTHLVVILDRDKYPIGSPRAGEYKSWSGMMPNLIEFALELKKPIFCCMVPNWPGVKDVNDFLSEIDYDLVEFKRYLANNARTLGDLALEMYKDTLENHDLLWSLYKQQPDPSCIASMKTHIESLYPSWTDYMLAKAC